MNSLRVLLNTSALGCSRRLTSFHRTFTVIPSTYQFISVKKIPAITIIQIERLKSLNAVNQATAKELRHAFEEFEQDCSQKIAILTGCGGNFCAGYDLKSVAKTPQDSHDLEKAFIAINDSNGPGPSKYVFYKQ